MNSGCPHFGKTVKAIGHVNNIPTMHFFINVITNLSVSGISKIMHCGYLINSPTIIPFQ